ncbi:M96 mating-specific protein family, partial [Phytophthora palmivora]
MECRIAKMGYSTVRTHTCADTAVASSVINVEAEVKAQADLLAIERVEWPYVVFGKNYGGDSILQITLMLYVGYRSNKSFVVYTRQGINTILTRQEHDAFMARLDGLDQVERYRLLQEHKAYLDGEREVDADFRDNVAPARTIKRSSTRKPPTGKAASYAVARAAAQDGEESNGRSAKRATKVQPKHGTATRKFTKKQLAAIAWEEKAAKEARAMARVEAEATLRSESKERERKRLAREEKEGAVARHQALDDLKRKRARGNTSVKTKKKDERSDKEEEDADDQSERQDPVIEETSPTTPICATPSDVFQSTLIDVNVSSILPAAPPADVVRHTMCILKTKVLLILKRMETIATLMD